MEKVRRRVIRDKNIHQTIVVKITADHAQPIVAVGIRNAGLPGYVSERAIAIVVIETIARALQTSGPALHRYTFELASASFAELRQIIHIEIYIVGDEEIELAIVIVIDESSAGGPTRIADT